MGERPNKRQRVSEELVKKRKQIRSAVKGVPFGRDTSIDNEELRKRR